MVLTERFHSYFTSWSKVKSYTFCKQAGKIPNNQMDQNEKDEDNDVRLEIYFYFQSTKINFVFISSKKKAHEKVQA